MTCSISGVRSVNGESEMDESGTPLGLPKGKSSPWSVEVPQKVSAVKQESGVNVGGKQGRGLHKGSRG